MKAIKSKIYCVFVLILLAICSSVMQDSGFASASTLKLETSKSAILIDFDTKTIAYEKDKDKKLPIASMVKLMTIYLTFKSIEEGKLDYEQNITTSENASSMGGSQVFIDPYVNYSVNDLLKSVIISSANDASVALAEAISGSEFSFVSLMNDTAKSLGMNNTLYVNCTGLPAPEQYSTAYDCSLILCEVLKFDKYHEYSKIWMDELVHPSGRKTELVNTNKLIRYFEGCDGGKTGSTSEAGYCLSASAKRGNMRLVSVVIGAKTGNDRFKESTELLNYGFANFQNKVLVDKETVIKTINTSRCKQKTAEVVATDDYFVFDKKGTSSNYDIAYEIPNYITKTKAGEKIGEVIISKDGCVVKTISLTIKSDLESITIKDNFKSIIENW